MNPGARSLSNSHGECQASPDTLPLWLRHSPETAMARNTSYSSWTVQA